MDRMFIAAMLALLVVVALIALYVGNNLPPTASPPTATDTAPPATQPTPTNPAP
jgi:hypothetical protein